MSLIDALITLRDRIAAEFKSNAEAYAIKDDINTLIDNLNLATSNSLGALRTSLGNDIRDVRVTLSQVSGLADALDNFAFSSTVADIEQRVSGLSGTVAAKFNSVDFNSFFDGRLTPQRGVANGLATLGSDAKLSVSQVPAIAITDSFLVVSEAAMLALAAETGDVAIRSDISKSFILSGDPAVLGNWRELKSPTAGVVSVNGLSGTVVLSTTEITEGSNAYFTEAKVLQTTLSGFVAGGNSALAQTDTVLQALAKVQGQISGRLALSAVTSFSLTLLNDSSAAEARTTLGLGTAASEDVTAFATPAQLAAKLDAAAVSAFGATLIDDADAATARATLGLGTAATQATGNFAAAAHANTADVLTGFAVPGVKTDVIATDTVLSAFGKLQKYLNDLAAAVPVYKNYASWKAGGSTTITNVGAAALTATGTATGAANAATNTYTQLTRLEYLVTVAATTAVAGWRLGTALWWRGNAAGLGGFRFRCRWGNATGAATATNRCFVGMANTVAVPTDVEPSSQLNVVGMGWDAADSNIQIMVNDGSGVATKVDLGANFPVPLTDRSEFYDLDVWCDANSAVINYSVVRGTTGQVANGVLSADLPLNTNFLAPRGWMSVGGTSSVIGIALMSAEVGSNN